MTSTMLPASAEGVLVSSANATVTSRLRLWLAVAITFALLFLLADGWIRGGSSFAPIVIIATRWGWLAAPIVAVVLIFGAWLGTFLIVRRDACDPLMIAGLALAAWSLLGGTSDDWLKLCRPIPGPPTGGAYWYFVLEYAFLIPLFLVISIIGALRPTTPASVTTGTARSEELIKGIAATAVSTALMGALLCILFGPTTNETRHGQVLFAVIVASAAGTWGAWRATRARQPIWYCLAPMAVGLLGAVLAASRPTLFVPETFRNLDTLAASGMVRPLPVQMIGIGVVSAVLTLRSACRPALPAAGAAAS